MATKSAVRLFHLRRRALKWGAAALAACSALSVAAAPSGPRPGPEDGEVIAVVEAEYLTPAMGFESRTLETGVFAYSCPNTAGCVRVDAPARSRWAVIEVVDAISPRSQAFIANTNTWLCDSPSEPIDVYAGGDVTVYMTNGDCGGLPAASTTGIVRVTFLGLPEAERSST